MVANLEIEDDPYFQNFLKRRRLSESTQIVYSGRIKAFCEFLGKSPSQLIEDAQITESKINQHLQDYIKNLKKNGKSSRTIINRLDTVKAFYKEYNLESEGINQILFNESDIYTERLISSDEIKEALQLSSFRDKAIILLHMSSGMEAQELQNLTYGDFIYSLSDYVDLKDFENLDINLIESKISQTNNLAGTWKIKNSRTGKSFVTFNSPESTKAILSYLIDRERKNKPIKSLKDPLFVNWENQTLNISTHGSIFKRINERANFGYISKNRRFFSSSMLRKYFKNKLIESGMDEKSLNAILGHKLHQDIDYFSLTQIRQLKENYLQAVDNLTLEKVDKDTVSTKEYEKLIKLLKEKDKELNEIKKHLNHIKQIID